MQFEISDNGKLVLREVTDEAWAYINSEMNRLLTNPRFQHWYFSRERYDGTVYLTITPEEDKAELVRIFDVLVQEYGLTSTESAFPLLRAWRRDAAYSRESERANEERRALEGQLKALKRIIEHGCKECGSFYSEQVGDDLNGYCMQGEERRELESSTLSCAHGEFDADKKVYHLGRKFYPCSGCKYLKGERA